MLQGLRHHAFDRRDDQQQHVHSGRAGEHVVQKAFVPRHVHDARFRSTLENQVREPKVERHPAQLLFRPTIGIGPRESGDESRLSVIDMTRRADDTHHSAAVTTYL